MAKASNWEQIASFAYSADLFRKASLAVYIREAEGEITVMHAQGPCSRQYKENKSKDLQFYQHTIQPRKRWDPISVHVHWKFCRADFAV